MVSLRLLATVAALLTAQGPVRAASSRATAAGRAAMKKKTSKSKSRSKPSSSKPAATRLGAARVVKPSQLPHKVREVKNLWIKVPGGRLAARMWIPEGAGKKQKVPTILEYLPYSKSLGTFARDATNAPYLAAHGYAVIRVDIAGTGDSTGSAQIADEYTEREMDDAVRVMEWIEEQPWSTGKVGMMGISWGGFNSQRVAARKPRQLGGILVVHSSDDGYTDDAHYKGGALLTENMLWGNGFLHHRARPPDPRAVGKGWSKVWLARLARLQPSTSRWLTAQDKSAPPDLGVNLWKGNAADLSKIDVPAYAIGGWADGYASAVPRIVSRTAGPARGVIGPWAHAYPHVAAPGPQIGFLQETVRFFDHALKGKKNGVLDGPKLTVWMQDSVAPDEQHVTRPGRWVDAAAAPIARTSFHLGPKGTLSRKRVAAPRKLTLRSPQTTGRAGGRWAPFGAEDELASDQRAEAKGSLSFDMPALRERTEILGAPEVTLKLASDQAHGDVVVRLNDVAPDGRITRVTYGVLNLAHRDGDEHPRAMEPGKDVTVRVRLNDIAHAFLPGHRIQLAVSNAYWPMVWPSARKPAQLTVTPEDSKLDLPIRRGATGDGLNPFLEPEQAPPIERVQVRAGHEDRRLVQFDRRTGELVTLVDVDRGAFEDPSGLIIEQRGTQEYRIREGDPLSARVKVTSDARWQRGRWKARTVVETEQTATATHFRVKTTLRALQGDKEVFHRTWDQEIPRGP
jgi:putative CocE/NonD family hydrolase